MHRSDPIGKERVEQTKWEFFGLWVLKIFFLTWVLHHVLMMYLISNAYIMYIWFGCIISADALYKFV